MTENPPAKETVDPAPTRPEDRIVSLDALRGFALLGILVVNMWFFSMPLAGVMLPGTYGDFTGLNFAAWFLGHVFFEMKFVALFTIMFGAGIVLFTQNKERKDQPARRLYYRRIGWLLLIGLGHAYLLWYGDILVTYALAGILVVSAREWEPRKLATVGIAMFAIPALLYGATAGAALGADDPGVTAEIEETLEVELGADEAAMATEIEYYRGSWTEQLNHRVPTAFDMHTVQFLFANLWHVGGLMLIGMAAFKRGILSNERSRAWYGRVLAGGLFLGLAVTLAGVWYREAVDWSSLEVLTIGFQFTYWASIPLAFAYLSGIMLWCDRRPTGMLTIALAAVGRTAFSNYLFQTVIATSLFYGHGLGWFGRVSYAEGLVIVVLIWAIQIPVSVLWLRYYRFGPVEWVWRTLTYRQRQPLRRD